MEERKKLFKNPKKTIVSIIGIIVILMILGAGVFFTLNAIAGKKARNAAYADAGIDAANVKFVHTELDFEWGHFIYEIEFIVDGIEYEYWVKASDSTIIKKEVDYAAHTKQQTVSNVETNTVFENTDAANTAQNTGPNDSSQNTEAIDNSSAYIGVDKAKEIAVSHAGFSVSDVIFAKAKLEKDDGYVVYEIEFYEGNWEYEYKIDAVTGTIKEFDID